ncbi:MAG TPA: HAD family hydrolase [Candidatus Saccharimonadales bacterium]|nr:HAD family hydrolase [Candidatus Saccharimonadales bacterium]
MNALECHKVHVVACDLDDSLVATQSHSEQSRRASDEALRQVGQLITNLRTQGETVHFGSATGRTFASVQELASKRSAFGEIFQTMDFHITSVGAAIYRQHEGASHFTHIPNWPNVNSWNRAALIDRLSTYPDLTPQEPTAQDDRKLSYRTTSITETTMHALQIGSYLGAASLQADVIVSGNGPWRFVDILPIGVNKGSALLQLPQLLESGLNDDSFSLSDNSVCRVAAGDSMNDQAVLAVADFSIIPGNGQPDLLSWAADNQPAGSLYIANEPCAAGVLRGLQRHIYGYSN